MPLKLRNELLKSQILTQTKHIYNHFPFSRQIIYKNPLIKLKINERLIPISIDKISTFYPFICSIHYTLLSLKPNQYYFATQESKLR